MSRNEIESIFNLWNGGFGSDFDLRPPNVIRDGWLTVHVSRTSGNAFIVKFSRTAGKGCHGHRLQTTIPPVQRQQVLAQPACTSGLDRGPPRPDPPRNPSCYGQSKHLSDDQVSRLLLK